MSTLAETALTPVSIELHHEITQFLYHEANLLDDWKFRDWLDLLGEDIHYAMRTVVNAQTRDRRRSVQPPTTWIFNENKFQLERRVALGDGSAGLGVVEGAGAVAHHAPGDPAGAVHHICPLCPGQPGRFPVVVGVLIVLSNRAPSKRGRLPRELIFCQPLIGQKDSFRPISPRPAKYNKPYSHKYILPSSW